MMTLIHPHSVQWVPPRDDLTVPQFIVDLESAHFTRPSRPANIPCFVDEDTGHCVFLEELQTRTRRLSRGLRGRWNISPGDVVSIFAPNHIDYGVVAWAVHRCGGAVATHNSTLTVKELVYQLQVVKPVLLVAHSENLYIARAAMKGHGFPQDKLLLLDSDPTHSSPLPTIAHLINTCKIDHSFSDAVFSGGEARLRIAYLCFSSGTTGLPKAVAISHYNVISAIVQLATFNRVHEDYAPWEDRRFRPGDVCAGVLPFSHVYGLVINLHLMLYGAMTVIVSKKFQFEQLLRSIERYRITHISIVPPVAVLLCKHPLSKKYDLSSIRYCVVAAAPLSAEVTNQLLEVFPGLQLGQGWGMTETCAAGSMFPLSQRVGTLGSCGQLLPGTVAKVVKSDGTLSGFNEPGELYFRGPQVALGYYNNDEATREAFFQGWIRTGDEVVIRSDGDIFIIGRIKELISVKGHKVPPSELEGYLLSHPDVSDAAVVGVPDKYAGELPLAYVVLKPDVLAEAAKNDKSAVDERSKLYQHVAKLASRHKWLDGGIIFIDAVPRNASGKILRGVLNAGRANRDAMKTHL